MIKKSISTSQSCCLNTIALPSREAPWSHQTRDIMQMSSWLWMGWHNERCYILQRLSHYLSQYPEWSQWPLLLTWINNHMINKLWDEVLLIYFYIPKCILWMNWKFNHTPYWACDFQELGFKLTHDVRKRGRAKYLLDCLCLAQRSEWLGLKV